MSATIIPNAELLDRTLLFDSTLETAGVLGIKIPQAFRPGVQVLMERSWDKHSGFVKLGIDLPFKPRTPKAQGKLHALIADLAPLIDMSADECKLFVKMEATAIGYPMVIKTAGKRTRSFPMSEAEASTVQEHLLIETVLKIGAEAGHDLEARYRHKMRGMT